MDGPSNESSQHTCSLKYGQYILLTLSQGTIMNKNNSVFLLVTLSAASISLNTRAAEHGMITLNQNSGNLQPISPLVLLASANGASSSFEVQHLANSYNRYGNKVKIEFTMSSEQLINYYIYITNSTGITYYETSGFINNSQKNINLEIEDIPEGNYNLVIDSYNNDQKSITKKYQINVRQHVIK
ncbi:N-acetylglucosamine-binding protein A [Yersinia pseudotuberculosis]|nr:N-acetylglucosamine-binding protein A [Yersinia pseudotuberculosis]